MRPPYYNTILSALHLQDRYGLTAESVNKEAEAIRRSCLDNSPYREKNAALWRDFIEKNPSDKAAKYMREYVS